MDAASQAAMHAKPQHLRAVAGPVHCAQAAGVAAARAARASLAAAAVAAASEIDDKAGVPAARAETAAISISLPMEPGWRGQASDSATSARPAAQGEGGLGTASLLSVGRGGAAAVPESSVPLQWLVPKGPKVPLQQLQLSRFQQELAEVRGWGRQGGRVQEVGSTGRHD